MVDKFKTAFTVLGITGIVYILSAFIYTGLLKQEMHDTGRKALRTQIPVESSLFGRDIYADFTRGEYANTSIVTSGDRQIIEHDLNKSKMLGHYVGEKTKEGVRGFWQGWSSKGKHVSVEDKKP